MKEKIAKGLLVLGIANLATIFILGWPATNIVVTILCFAGVWRLTTK